MEKLLVTSNFSFSHNIFNSYISLLRQNSVLCGNGLSQAYMKIPGGCPGTTCQDVQERNIQNVASNH